MPLDRADVFARLTPVFRDVFDDDEVTPGEATTAADVDGWDSLAHIRLVVAIEVEFRVKFSTAELNGLANVGQMVDLIREKTA